MVWVKFGFVINGECWLRLGTVKGKRGLDGDGEGKQHRRKHGKDQGLRGNLQALKAKRLSA